MVKKHMLCLSRRGLYRLLDVGEFLVMCIYHRLKRPICTPVVMKVVEITCFCCDHCGIHERIKCCGSHFEGSLMLEANSVHEYISTIPGTFLT